MKTTNTNALLIAAVEQAAESIIITDTLGGIVYANETAARASGYSRSELIGRNVTMLASDDTSSDVLGDVLTTIRRGEVWQGHWVGRRKDGSAIRQEATFSPIRDEAGRVVSLVSAEHDVTFESELGQQLSEARKQEAISHFAGKVAHDLSNILLGIRSNASSAMIKMASDHPARADIEESVKALDSAAEVLRKLLAFGRRAKLHPEHLDLKGVASRTVESVRKSLPAGVSVEVKSAGRLYGVYGDEAMLGSAIRDLCANSAEAMPNGGRIVVETENATLDEEFCRKYPWARRGDYVRLSVRDDGSGIPENIRRRVFEPFFTTKESGGGLGLGLSLAYTATKRHDGFLNLASEEGKGTVVDIYLPRDIEGEKPARPAAAAGLSRRTILIAEDEELVRKIAIKVLENAGFDVLVARDGEEACELFNDNADRISLAFLDISMPRKNGKEVYRLISGARPGLPVVFSSGYGYSALEGGADDLPNTPMVRKPYTPSELVRQLREALGDPAS